MSGSPHNEDNAARQRHLTAELARLGAETRTERSVKRILPWVISVAIHTVIFMLAIFITWTVTNRPKKESSELIVADFNAMQYAPVTASSPQSDQSEAAPSDFSPPGNPLPSADQFIGQNGTGEVDLTSILGDSMAAPGNADAAFARIAPHGGGGGGHSVSFAGVSGSNARRIVYAIDASGSMIASIQIVIDELARSLGNLSPQQSFSVIFFQGEQAIEVPPAGKLTPASAESRERTLKWIRENVVPRGSTNPLAALKQAMKLKPDVIFLLSQDITGYGQFEIDQRDLLALLDKLNPRDPSGRRATQIDCIQFMDVDPLETMQAIAREHGGPNGYKFLSRRDLGIGQ